jgi:acetyl-CoA carboxylase carboxyltransferase component
VVTVNAAIAKTPVKVFTTSSLVNIEIENAAAGSTVIYLYDVSGRMISEQTANLVAGYNLVKINRSLSKTVYFIKVVNGATISTQKFIGQ